jgi:hypothetical protein
MVIGEAIAHRRREIACRSTFLLAPSSYYSPERKSKYLSPVLSIVVDLAGRVLSIDANDQIHEGGKIYAQ